MSIHLRCTQTLSEPFNVKNTKAALNRFAMSCKLSLLHLLHIGMKLLVSFTVVKSFTNPLTVGAKQKNTSQ